jgi:hypothetical protein
VSEGERKDIEREERVWIERGRKTKDREKRKRIDSERGREKTSRGRKECG